MKPNHAGNGRARLLPSRFTLTISVALRLGGSLALPVILAATACGGDLPQKPIATSGGKVGELLRQWWKEGTAAGNAGDFYDNRDGDHSPLSLAPYPQMSAIKYSPEDIKLRKHWAAQHTLLPHVTFGNSSTSAPAHLGGSNPRSYYVNSGRLMFLYNQYTKNNLYFYPEHRDHDPGHNGVYFPGQGVRDEGYGDMYPTNTPYLIISQGSSGSDQPFMRMMPHVLAAFRPDVKKKLTETGLLMPTIQMLMRSTYKELKDPKEYLTAKAHPTVFEGSRIDELAMAQKAHEIDIQSLPPMVQLRVIDEDKATNGIDYFDLWGTERLADTPGCIARIHRSKSQTRRIVVSADASFDVNKRPLTYTWVVLRGDADKIKIVPKKDDVSVAEITVAYHDRRPIAPGSPMASNRVDIGVFVHNGVHFSAPAFVTYHTLDRETRTYSKDGKILSIAHGMGETEIRVMDWYKLLSHLCDDQKPAATLLKIDKEQLTGIGDFAQEYRLVINAVEQFKLEVKKAEAAVTDAKEPTEKEKAKKRLDEARKHLTNWQRELNDHLDSKQKRLADSPRNFVMSRVAKLVQDPLFTQTQQAWLKERRTPANEPRLKPAWDKLRRLGIVNNVETLTPLLPGRALADAHWTPFERAQLEWLHATLLAELAFPGMLQVEWRVNYVDQRLSIPREWRDVYRHDPNGVPIGWMRYSADGVQIFNHEGLLAVERDPAGRVLKARTVTYVQDPSKVKGINPNPLRLVLGDTIVRYEFADGKDWLGRRAGTEPAVDLKK